MDQSLYFEYTTENQEILADMLETGFYDLSRLHIFETVKTVRPLSFYLHKGFDLIAAAAAGCLIYPTRTGADAAYVDPDNTADGFTDVELKFAEVDQNKIFQSWKNTLYVAKDIEHARHKNTRSSLRSSIEASYKLHSLANRQSKNMPTILVAFDRTANEIIDVYKLDGETVMKYLNRSEKANRTIKLSAFVEHGTQVPCDLSYGLQSWEMKMQYIAPTFYN
jgi:hypothetical protein